MSELFQLVMFPDFLYTIDKTSILRQILQGVQSMKLYLSELDRVQDVSKSFKSQYITSIQVNIMLTPCQPI